MDEQNDSTIRCIVVDDEPLARSLITSYISKTPFLKLVGQAGSAKEALALITDTKPDLIFLDIEMPGMTGMELAKFIPETSRVIFVTAYEHYAIQGFKVNAVDYLLKPVSYAEFLDAASRALKAISATTRPAEQPTVATSTDKITDHIIVKSDYKYVQIRLDDILFIEGIRDYVKIYTRQDATRPIVTLLNLKTLEQRLSDKFMRVHRSFIINTDNILYVERGTRIVFPGDHYIPVGDTYRPAFSTYLASKSLTNDTP